MYMNPVEIDLQEHYMDQMRQKGQNEPLPTYTMLNLPTYTMLNLTNKKQIKEHFSEK